MPPAAHCSTFFCGTTPSGRQRMSKNGRFGRQDGLKRLRRLRPQRSVPMQGRDIIRLEEHFKIAPKHPGMGRR